MEQGSYSRKVDFDSFLVDRFIAHLFTGSNRYVGCGATALGLLTGVAPVSLTRTQDWSPRKVLSFLRSKGFKTANLTQKNLTNFHSVEHPLTSRHVVLAQVRLIKGEATWVVLHDGMSYHNFEASQLGAYEMLDHPPMSAFLITHPTWVLRKRKKLRRKSCSSS